METLVVSEIFGPTVQGEGPYSGHPVAFLRLGRCNLDCKWCDTPYTWDWKGKNGITYDPAKELQKVQIDEVLERICEHLPGTINDRIVISGGEPLLQRNSLEALAGLIKEREPDLPIDIETNGTLAPLFVPGITYVVSPKLKSSGVAWNPKWYKSIKTLSERAGYGFAWLKFVITDPEDFRQVDNIVRETGFPPWCVYVMPQGVTKEELDENCQWVADLAMLKGYLYSDRLHVRFWNDERGK